MIRSTLGQARSLPHGASYCSQPERCRGLIRVVLAIYPAGCDSARALGRAGRQWGTSGPAEAAALGLFPLAGIWLCARAAVRPHWLGAGYCGGLPVLGGAAAGDGGRAVDPTPLLAHSHAL